MSRLSKLRHSIFFKFSIAFILVGLLPLFILSYLSLQTLTNQVEGHTESNLEQIILFMSLNMDKMFTEYNEISKLMYMNNEISNIVYLNRDEDPTSHDNSHHIQENVNHVASAEFLRNVLYTNRYIQNVIFVRSMDGKVFYQDRERVRFNANALPLEEWMQPLLDKPKQLAIIPPHDRTYFYGSTKQVFTIGRNLIDMSGRVGEEHILGTLFIDIDIELLNHMFREINVGEKDEIFILDEQGNILYSKNKEHQGKRYQDMPQSYDMLVIEESIPFIQGKVVTQISKSALYLQLTHIRETVLTAIIICLLATIIMSITFSRIFTRPILRLMRQMGRVESGNLNVRLVTKSRDEFGRLAIGFNRMVDRLQQYINEAYVAEIKHKQTELNALKSQIRPHYLYNTLEVIRMSAVYNDDEEVADMIHSLSNQLKYVIDYGEEFVTIERELHHLEDYFSLIKVRFESKIELEIHIQKGVEMEWLIPKLSIQPLVENAIQHGIRPKSGKGTILVSIEMIKHNQLAITVFDDGIGMEPDKVQQLNKQLDGGYVSSNKSIGMKNVNQRIKTLYAKEYGLDVSSRPHVGTSVRILIPLNRGGYRNDSCPASR